MQKRRIIASILLLLGLFFAANSKANMTGAAIGVSILPNINLVFSMVFILGSVILFVFETKRRQEYMYRDLENILKDFGRGEKVAIVLDASAVIGYNRFNDILKEYSKDQVNVPAEVMKEISPQRREMLGEHAQIVGEGRIKPFRRSADRVLEQTPKPQLYKTLYPYLTGEKRISSSREQNELADGTRRIRRIMEEEGWDIGTAEKYPRIFLDKVKDYLEKHCKVSKADVDVLATALYRARHRKDVKIFARDTDLRDAIGLIKKKNPKIGKYIEYVEYGEWK